MHSFVDYISSVQPPTANNTNIYVVNSWCRHNLSVYIERMLEIRPTILFMGEAPGYRGCGITGIPFTDEYTLATHAFFKGSGYLFDTPPASEPTARCVWSCINEVVPLMWNIYPFHPFAANERTNRKPNSAEIRLGKEIAKRFVSFFQIEKIYAVGRTVQAFGKSVEYVRHPSFGGQNIFRESCRRILQV